MIGSADGSGITLRTLHRTSPIMAAVPLLMSVLLPVLAAACA